MNNKYKQKSENNEIRKKKKKQWFTLVELIVVITILAILWTIAFISLQSYTKNARDWVRVSDINNISKWIVLYQAKSWILPLPEQFTTINASWTIIRYQWIAWLSVLNTAWLWNLQQWAWKDPVTWEYYTYSTDWNMFQYQLVWYFESLAFNYKFSNKLISKLNIIENVNSMYTWAIIRTFWDDLWIIWDQVLNKPINETMNWTWSIDIRNTTNIYNVLFNASDEIVWTWWQLFSQIYNRDKVLLNNPSLAPLDDSLIWYWDMETTTIIWSNTYMKDLSKYSNDCNFYSNDLEFVDWVKWKWLNSTDLSLWFTAPCWNWNLDEELNFTNFTYSFFYYRKWYNIWFYNATNQWRRSEIFAFPNWHYVFSVRSSFYWDKFYLEYWRPNLVSWL